MIESESLNHIKLNFRVYYHESDQHLILYYELGNFKIENQQENNFNFSNIVNNNLFIYEKNNSLFSDFSFFSEWNSLAKEHIKIVLTFEKKSINLSELIPIWKDLMIGFNDLIKNKPQIFKAFYLCNSEKRKIYKDEIEKESREFKISIKNLFDSCVQKIELFLTNSKVNKNIKSDFILLEEKIQKILQYE
jgi:hypothetical protein